MELKYKNMSNYIEYKDKVASYKMQPEYYNAFVCSKLSQRFELMSHHLQIEPMSSDNDGFF